MLVVNGSMTCFQKHTKCDLEVCTHDINKFIFVLLYLNRRFFLDKKDKPDDGNPECSHSVGTGPEGLYCSPNSINASVPVWGPMRLHVRAGNTKAEGSEPALSLSTRQSLSRRTPTRVRACNLAAINNLNHAANLSHRASVETCDPL